MSFPFKLISCLGHGSFGVVLKAQEKSKDTYSAVKIIFTSGKLEDTKNLKRECEIMEGKHHKNVVKVINVTETVFANLKYLNQISKLVDDEEIHFQIDAYMGILKRKKTLPVILIEMELCGATLREWINQHVIHDKEDLELQLTQINIIKGMISGMQFLHVNKIIHRDFKPENVMFSISNEEDRFPFPLKIGDFGLCRILHSEESKTSELTSRMGSLDYRAPEMDGNIYNFQSDIYSLGLVIWEVVRLIPFKGRKTLFNELVVEEKVELVVSFEPSISSAIISMTKRKLEERMKSIVEVEGINDSPITLFKGQLAQLAPITVRNGQELKDILLKCSEGDIINLAEGEFEGSFKINCSNLKIVGQGSKTVLKCHNEKEITIEICGNNNCVSNIDIIYASGGVKLVGSDNSIFNVGLIRHCNLYSNALMIEGSRNKISGLKISNSVLSPQNKGSGPYKCGIQSHGDYNTLENIEINNLGTGIILSGSNSTVTNFIINNTIQGIFIDGSQNKISTIKYIRDDSVTRINCCGVEVRYSENDFEDIQCTGMQYGEWGFCINLDSVKKCKISNSSCGSLLISGSEHTLINVDCGPSIQLEGVRHKLIKCKGKELLKESQHSHTFVLEDNNFDEVVDF